MTKRGAMLKRRITDKLIAWKNRPSHKPLLLQGARQVGKTYSVRHFGKKHYEHVIEINFEQNPQYAAAFEQSLDVNTIITLLSALLPSGRFIPQKTLLFFDEIQQCPQARTSLKFFAQDGRFDVIAAGSLLGAHYKEVHSNPVGYVERLTLYSLDFEEFLWAKGYDDPHIDLLKKII